MLSRVPVGLFSGTVITGHRPDTGQSIVYAICGGNCRRSGGIGGTPFGRGGFWGSTNGRPTSKSTGSSGGRSRRRVASDRSGTAVYAGGGGSSGGGGGGSGGGGGKHGRTNGIGTGGGVILNLPFISIFSICRSPPCFALLLCCWKTLVAGGGWETAVKNSLLFSLLLLVSPGGWWCCRRYGPCPCGGGCCVSFWDW